MRFLEDSKPMYSFDYTVLDYCEPGIKFGVGEARKIGMEYAMAKWLDDPQDRIVSLDADTLVNQEYIVDLYNHPLTSYGFTIDAHHPTDDEAMVMYELFLRYVPFGLTQAGSPFNFIAIGSAMGCTVEGYKKSGGMMAKSATEDFHFLNKLRKLGKIETLHKAKVFPSNRRDGKVTLGTGVFLQSTGKGLEKALQKLVIPRPDEFMRLKKVIQNIQDFYAQDSLLALFEESQDLESFEHLRDRGMVDKLYQIKEGCTEMHTYFQRIMEVMDGLETIRLLRKYRDERNPVTISLFTQWCQSILNTQEQSVIGLLQAFRNI